MKENLGVQGSIDLLNNVYNLVHQHNSQLLVDWILRIEKDLQYTPLRDNSVREAASRGNQVTIQELVPISTISP